jgi:hypothetical protein
MCQLCEKQPEELYCDSCAEELRTKIGMKCLSCGTIGFIERTEKNIARLEFFMGEDFRAQLNSYQICIIPMAKCPDCVAPEYDNRICPDILH